MPLPPPEKNGALICWCVGVRTNFLRRIEPILIIRFSPLDGRGLCESMILWLTLDLPTRSVSSLGSSVVSVSAPSAALWCRVSAPSSALSVSSGRPALTPAPGRCSEVLRARTLGGDSSSRPGSDSYGL